MVTRQRPDAAFIFPRNQSADLLHELHEWKFRRAELTSVRNFSSRIYLPAYALIHPDCRASSRPHPACDSTHQCRRVRRKSRGEEAGSSSLLDEINLRFESCFPVGPLDASTQIDTTTYAPMLAAARLSKPPFREAPILTPLIVTWNCRCRVWALTSRIRTLTTGLNGRCFAIRRLPAAVDRDLLVANRRRQFFRSGQMTPFVMMSSSFP